MISLAGARSRAYLKPGLNPLTDPRWLARFEENTVGNHPPKGYPVLYYHAFWDEASPYRDAVSVRRKYSGDGIRRFNLTRRERHT